MKTVYQAAREGLRPAIRRALLTREFWLQRPLPFFLPVSDSPAASANAARCAVASSTSKKGTPNV